MNRMFSSASSLPFSRPNPLGPSLRGPHSQDSENDVRNPAVKLGPSDLLSTYLDLPTKALRTRRDFEVYNDGQFEAAETLHAKEIFAGNRIKLCVGVDPSVTEHLRLSKEGGEPNRRLLRDREEYLARHPVEESFARSVYDQVQDQVIDLLKTEFFHCVWPFAMVFSCYEFTSHRRNFQHGHCLYLMVSVPHQEIWSTVETLHKLVQDMVRSKDPNCSLHVIIQEIAQQGQLIDDRPRLLESNSRHPMPRNLDYHARPPMGSSIGPVSSGSSGTIGGYVTTQAGKVYAVTASHTVGDPYHPIVSPSTVDLEISYRHARAKEELALYQLEFHMRSMGPENKETLEARRKWEIAQEELLTFADIDKVPGPVCQLGTVYRKSQGPFFVSHGGPSTLTYLDLALIECHAWRTGFNTILCTSLDGSSNVLEVNAGRSPIHGERVIKNGRSTGLTQGLILSALAVVGYFEQQSDIMGLVSLPPQPQVIRNWCITSNRRFSDDIIFAAPGDSGAWILSEPPETQGTEATDVLVTHTPVVGALLHGFLSAEGVDLVIFQPWECMTEGFKRLIGEECVPFLPLTNHIALCREQQGTTNGCGICLQQGVVDHQINHCPERFLPEERRSRYVMSAEGVKRLKDATEVIGRYRLNQIASITMHDPPEATAHQDEDVSMDYDASIVSDDQMTSV